MKGSAEIEKHVDNYKSTRNWQRIKEEVEKNATAIQLLSQSITKEGKAGTKEASALYFLCLIDNVYSSAKKKSAIDDLKISSENKQQIKRYIDKTTGIVGGPSFQLRIPEENEQDFLELLSKLLNSDSKEERKDAVNEFASKEITGIQSAKLSPILYFLHPKEFPINNNLSRDGMEEYFDKEISGQLEDYVDEIGKYKKVRDKYNLKKNYRDLDFFFIWVDQRGKKQKDYYWVNQKKGEEIEEEYLQAPIDNFSHHKLMERLKPGDVVFHYNDKQLIGFSEVESSCQEIEVKGEEKYRVDVTLKEFDTPLPLEKFADYLNKDEIKTEGNYPFNKEGRVNQGYLFKLSKKAAEYLKNMDLNPHYFWISVNPDTWRVSNLDTGEERSYTAYTTDLNKRKVFDSFEKAKPGDKVIFYESGKVGQVVGEGEITRGLHPEENENYDEPVESISFIYLNPVDGLSWSEINEIPELENSIPVRNNAEGSIFELTEEEYEKLLGTHKPEKRTLLNIHNSELNFSDLNPTENLHFPDNIRKEIKTSISAALKSGKNIIFTGPPGTGKTKIAENVARQMEQMNESLSGSIFTTATADWTTFDTIGGYHPKKETRELRFKPGQFLKCFKGKNGLPTNKWLIIDEINRADIDKAFGQLFSVLSKDDVELPFTNDDEEEISIISLKNNELNSSSFSYNENSYYVTKNWRLLATMNTYDKASLYEMSYAFMRRFAFIDVSVPTEEIGADLLEDYIAVWKELDLGDVQDGVLEKLSGIWESLNKGKRSIGPAIVKDLLLYIKESDKPGIASALKLYVLPQLEGMVKQDQKELVVSLSQHLEGSEKEILVKAAKERFEIKDQELKEELENE